MQRKWCLVIVFAACCMAATSLAQQTAYPTTSAPEPRLSSITLPSASSDSSAGTDEPFSTDRWDSFDVYPNSEDDESDDKEMLEELPLGEPAVWYQPHYWFGPVPWNTGIELGLNGSAGSNESLSFRTGGYIKRKSKISKLDTSLYYNRTTNGGITTQNNAQFDGRHDLLFGDCVPWTVFGSSDVFYDQFQAFDLQVSANMGIGYRFVDDDELTFIVRTGAGTSREFGGPDNLWVPESLFGFEYSQQLSAIQRFYGKLDYYPEWDEVGEYRYLADVGWEIEISRPSNLSLKISATDRFDSTPNGADAHLVNYSVLLLLKL